MPPGQPQKSRRRARWALSALALAVSLLAAEAVCRVMVWRENERVRADYERLQRRSLAAGTLPKDCNLAHIVRLSDHPEILFEMLPGIRDVNFLGARLDTDSHGFRGPERPVAKPANALRIVVLGDSVAFGWGVEEPDTVFRQLETRLRQALPDRQVDLINTAVPGYNTAIEVAVLEHRGLQFRPDLVIVDFCGNDTDLPNLLPRQTDVWALDRSYLWRLWERTTGSTDPWRQLPWDHAPLTAEGDRFECDPAKVPPQYRHMVGWSGWRAAMQRLLDLGARHGFRIVVTTHLNLPTQVAEFCAGHGLPVFAGGGPITDYMQRHGIAEADYQGSPLTISASDPHPSALHCRLQVEAMWQVLSQPGVLATLLAPR